MFVKNCYGLSIIQYKIMKIMVLETITLIILLQVV